MRRQSVSFTSHRVNASGSASDLETLFCLTLQATALTRFATIYEFHFF